MSKDDQTKSDKPQQTAVKKKAVEKKPVRSVRKRKKKPVETEQTEIPGVTTQKFLGCLIASQVLQNPMVVLENEGGKDQKEIRVDDGFLHKVFSLDSDSTELGEFYTLAEAKRFVRENHQKTQPKE